MKCASARSKPAVDIAGKKHPVSLVSLNGPKMKGTLKRKQTHHQSTGRSIKTTASGVGSPFSDHHWPTPEECGAVRDELLAFHGFPKEFMKYREQRMKAKSQLRSYASSEPLIGDELDEKESVLDGLVKTILSQNTTEHNSGRAFASLKSAFPTWEQVLAADTKCIMDAIRCGGLAPTKSSCIKNLLSCLIEKRGKLCMEYLRELSVDEIKAELSLFKGIGPKTVACVLMFNLQHDDFPVDTHVFQIAKIMGWVPPVADIKSTYLHLNHRIPADLKFDLNCLLYTHGKVCRRCSGRKLANKNKEMEGAGCPLAAHSGKCTVEKNKKLRVTGRI